ncbi:MAG: hypothetical protein IT430_03040 [Phycisphaerales bacterium]|nr:hypothetical protein [Phycisphaerales bacterium]
MRGAGLALRLPALLARANEWQNRLRLQHASASRSIVALGFRRLAEHFPTTLLDVARVVAVEQVPPPPLKQWGLPADVADAVAFPDAAGLTLGELVFVRRGLECDESLIFHELLHVIQWRQLGPRAFLAMYGLLLLRQGYHTHPLEETAYGLQRRFDGGELHGIDVEPLVQRALQEAVSHFVRQSLMQRLALGAARWWDRLA